MTQCGCETHIAEHMKEKAESSETKRLTRVAEGIYRYRTGGFYLRSKVSGRTTWHKLKSVDLQAARREARDHLRTGRQVDKRAARRTVADFLAAILAGYPEGSGTRRNHEVHARKIAAYWPGGAEMPISSVKAGHIREFMQKAFPDASGTYYNDVLAFLKRLFLRALEDHAIAALPDIDGKQKDSIWKRRRYKPGKVHIPDLKTWRKIVESVRSEQHSDTAEESADFLEAEGALGLGQAELASLIWADVDTKRMQISVRRVKTGEPFTVPIYPQAKELIERRKKITGSMPTNRVFTIKDPKVALTNACKKLGLPRYSQRTFRKMFITEALRNGVNVKTIASLQGHRDGGKLILQTYSAEINEAERSDAAEKIGTAFGAAFLPPVSLANEPKAADARKTVNLVPKPL